MPNMNQELLEAIKNPGFLIEDSTELFQKALNAIILADPKEPVNFRKAVAAHRAVWAKKEIKPDSIHEDWATKELTEMDDSYLSDDSFLDSSNEAFKAIHQAATEKRISLGLNAITDKNILINILTYNEDECRAYLEKKNKIIPGMPRPEGWKASKVHPDSPNTNVSSDILTPEAISRLKNQAANQLLLELINEQDKNPELLDEFIAAQNDPIGLKIAAQKLGYPTDSPESLNAFLG